VSKLPSIQSNKIINCLLKAGFDYAPIKGEGSHIALQSGFTREEFIKLME